MLTGNVAQQTSNGRTSRSETLISRGKPQCLSQLPRPTRSSDVVSGTVNVAKAITEAQLISCGLNLSTFQSPRKGGPLTCSMALSDLTVAVLLALLPLTSVLFALYSSYAKWHESPFRQTRLPPGPPPSGLLLGSQRDVPSSQAWVKYAEWAKKYGKLYSHSRASLPDKMYLRKATSSISSYTESPSSSSVQ